MINIAYAKAYTEVLEIIKYFPKEEYAKIPEEKIEFYKNNMDKDYNFKINPEISINRVTARGEKTEIYEKIEFQKKTADIYDQVINSYKQKEKSQGMKIITIDAEKPIDEISEIIWSSLKNIPIN